MELARTKPRHQLPSLIDYHLRLAETFIARIQEVEFLNPEASPFNDSGVPPDEILQGEEITAFFADFEPEARIMFYQHASTNNHPPPALYIFNGGRAIQYLTCEASGECGWCIGDGGAHAAACTDRINSWLDSVYSPTETGFFKQASGGAPMKRQYAQYGTYHDEVGSQNGEEVDDEQNNFVSPEDSISVVGINPDWDGDKGRWIPVLESNPQWTEILHSEHQDRRRPRDTHRPFSSFETLDAPRIIGYFDNWADD